MDSDLVAIVVLRVPQSKETNVVGEDEVIL